MRVGVSEKVFVCLGGRRRGGFACPGVGAGRFLDGGGLDWFSSETACAGECGMSGVCFVNITHACVFSVK